MSQRNEKKIRKLVRHTLGGELANWQRQPFLARLAIAWRILTRR
jgi:hypothetical protein